VVVLVVLVLRVLVLVVLLVLVLVLLVVALLLIAGCNLSKVRALAPEFYEGLRSHSSWTWVLWRFIVDEDVGCYSRVKRGRKEA